MKVCRRCGQEKPLDQFPRNRREPDGYQRWCKECKNAYARLARSRDPDKHRAYHREWKRARRAANPEAARAADRAKYWRNPERARLRQRRYRERHREKVIARVRSWYWANRERVLVYAREYGRRNRMRRAENQARRRARILWNTGEIRKIDREAIIKRDRSICHICGQWVAPEDLELDHIIPLSRGGAHTEDNLAVAHRWCNRSKHNKLPKEPAQRALRG